MTTWDKAVIIRDPEARGIWAFGRDWCMVCGRDGTTWPGLCVHHVAQGAARSDEACNFVMVCGDCHCRCHMLLEPHLPRLVQLRVKWCRDRDNWNLERMEQLLWQHLPPPEKLPPVPEELENEFRRRRPWDKFRFDLKGDCHVSTR